MRIYVGNLAFRSNAEDVRKAFAVHGQVTSVDLAIDRETGRSAGYAFVEMADDDEAQTAIARLHGKEINSRVVVVTVATEAPEPEPRTRKSASHERSRNNDRSNSRGPSARGSSARGPSSSRPNSSGPSSSSSQNKSPWSNRPRGKPPS